MLRLEKRGRFTPTPSYFEALVAKAILLPLRSGSSVDFSWAATGPRPWRTLAKLLNVTGQRVDLDAIWKSQELSDALATAIEDLGTTVHATLLESAGSKNVSEWAKKPTCWAAMQKLDWEPSSALSLQLVPASRATRTRNESSVAEVLSAEERTAMDAVLAVYAVSWFELAAWAKQTDNFQSWERGLAFSLGRLRSADKEPSRKQAVQGERILAEARRLGFRHAE